jgi:hypothetical protein
MLPAGDQGKLSQISIACDALTPRRHHGSNRPMATPPIRRQILWVCACFVLGVAWLSVMGAGCASTAPSEPESPILPKMAADLLHQSDYVEAYRVAPLADHPGAGGKVAGFAVLSAHSMADDQARKLAAAVTTASNLREPASSSTTSTFDPIVGYRFYRGSEEVAVLLSFSANQLLVVQKDVHRKEVYRHTWSIADSRPTFLQITKQAFPDNPQVTTLPDVR